MKRIFVLISALLLCAGASAQSMRSGYFLDYNMYGYRINPAQVNDKSFAGGLLLSNNCLLNSGNVGMGNFLFPKNGKLVTGLNKAVSSSEFLGNLPQEINFSLDESFNVFTLGLVRGDTQHTAEINVRTLGSIGLPKQLFAFLKDGGTQTYDISGVNANIGALADLTYGYAKRINSTLSVGGRAHILVGTANVQAFTDNSTVALTPTQSSLNTSITLQSSGLVKFGTDSKGNLNSVAMGSAIGGFGLSLDLGVEYKPIDGLNLMLSVTDLGFISWNNDVNLTASGSVSYNGGTIAFQDGTLKTDIDSVVDKLTGALAFKNNSSQSSISAIPFNLALGARYTLPSLQMLSFGLLGTYHNAGPASGYDLRAGVTATPSRLISATVNAGFGSYGPSLGGALNLHLGPINFFVGGETYMGAMGKLNGITIPLTGFMSNVNSGLVFTF